MARKGQGGQTTYQRLERWRKLKAGKVVRYQAKLLCVRCGGFVAKTNGLGNPFGFPEDNPIHYAPPGWCPDCVAIDEAEVAAIQQLGEIRICCRSHWALFSRIPGTIRVWAGMGRDRWWLLRRLPNLLPPPSLWETCQEAWYEHGGETWECWDITTCQRLSGLKAGQRKWSMIANELDRFVDDGALKIQYLQGKSLELVVGNHEIGWGYALGFWLETLGWRVNNRGLFLDPVELELLQQIEDGL